MPSLARRLMARVEKLPDAPGCWIWTGYCNADGYGKIGRRGGPVSVHRASYELFVGEIPDGLQVLHRCDVPCCANPAHLFLGTQRDNIADMVSKGRQRRSDGVRNVRAKLDPRYVLAIRERHAQGIPTTQIAREFAVSVPTAYRAWSGKCWAGVA